MSGLLIAAVGAAYLVIAVMEAQKGKVDIAMIFGGYAFSQIGLYISATK